MSSSEAGKVKGAGDDRGRRPSSTTPEALSGATAVTGR